MPKSINEIPTQAINIIGKDTQINGDINAMGDIRIDGELTGNINCKGKVIIGHSGIIKGEIHCNNCEIAGTVKGKIIVSELLSLKNSAKIDGDINVQKLSIEPGSKFSGSCSMEKTVNNGNTRPKEDKK